MEICRRKSAIEISELDPLLAELLRQIPASANPDGAPAAEQRLFSPPTNGKETELCAEWKMYVEPELRRLFQTATETVAADLEQLNGNEETLANRTLRIPSETCRRLVECAESGAARHSSQKQLHGQRAKRPFAFAHRIAPRLESVPGKLLRFPTGIYPARAGGLREGRSGN